MEGKNRGGGCRYSFFHSHGAQYFPIACTAQFEPIYTPLSHFEPYFTIIQ